MPELKKIKSFQGLRGWAIMMIVMSHYGISGNPMIGYWGALGVSIFFMLSGYLLVFHYYDIFYVRAISYIRKKIKKFYPLHFLTLMLCIPLIRGTLPTIGKEKALLAFLCNLLLIQTWIPQRDIYFSYNSVSWYLSVTMFFVILSPFIITAFHKYIKDKSFARLILIVCLLVVFEYVWGILTSKSEKAHYFSYICPPVRLVDFMIGGYVVL